LPAHNCYKAADKPLVVEHSRVVDNFLVVGHNPAAGKVVDNSPAAAGTLHPVADSPPTVDMLLAVVDSFRIAVRSQGFG